MAEITLAFGGNVGDVINTFRKAFYNLNEHGLILSRHSSIYKTMPVGCEKNATPFYNMVAIFESDITPEQLLSLIKQIEATYGRPNEHQHWVSRTLDIDILTYDTLKIQSESLQIPHPLMLERDFVLAPLLELTAKTIYINAYSKVSKTSNSILSKQEFIL